MDETADPAAATPQAAVPLAGQAPGSFSDRVPGSAWLIAAAFVAVELTVMLVGTIGQVNRGRRKAGTLWLGTGGRVG
jgi:hypothetical protein